MIHRAFSYELDSWAKSLEGGLTKALQDVASGRFKEDPPPPAATTGLRDYIRAVTKDYPADPGEDGELQPQPLDVLLLGRVLRAVGDPDCEIMSRYAWASHSVWA